MSRRGSSGGAKLGTRLALIIGLATLVSCGLLVVLVAQGNPERQGFGALLAALFAAVVALLAFTQGNRLATRLTDLRLALSKLGRGRAEMRLRIEGKDEVTALGREVQNLANDLNVVFAEIEGGAGTAATMDPQVREFRDMTLNEEIARPEGYEVDARVAAGSRGGLDYCGAIERVIYVVSAEGASALSVVACRMARDEIVRALNAGASARKALAHTNRVMHRQLPSGTCAKASLLELHDDQVKLYQAGYPVPAWICQAGETLELNADGLALGLDEGQVFEKSLRSESISVQFGVRLIQTNEAGLAMQELLDLVAEHSPKHTMPFMNLVLGGLRNGAGPDGLREDVLLATAKRGD